MKKVITKKMLLDVGACEIPEWFTKKFPKGFQVTKTNLQKLGKFFEKSELFEDDNDKKDNFGLSLHWGLKALGISTNKFDSFYWEDYIYEQIITCFLEIYTGKKSDILITAGMLMSAGACSIPYWFVKTFPKGFIINKKNVAALPGIIGKYNPQYNKKELDSSLRSALYWGLGAIKGKNTGNKFSNSISNPISESKLISLFWKVYNQN